MTAGAGSSTFGGKPDGWTPPPVRTWQARLLDTEGQVAAHVTLRGEYPPIVVELPVHDRLIGCYVEADEPPRAPIFRTIRFRHAGTDGGGTLVYYRETPLW